MLAAQRDRLVGIDRGALATDAGAEDNNDGEGCVTTAEVDGTDDDAAVASDTTDDDDDKADRDDDDDGRAT